MSPAKAEGQAWACCLPRFLRRRSAVCAWGPPPELEPEELQEALQSIALRSVALLCRDRLDVGSFAPDVQKFSILDTLPLRIKREVLRLASAELCTERAMGAMVGMAVADSVGAFLEFLPVGKKGSRFNPDTLQVEGSFNKFKLKPGQWTDDTSMGLCLADSLLVCRGYDGTDIRVRFWNWWHRGYNNAFRHDRERRHSVGLGGNVAVSLKDVMDSSPSPRFESIREDAGNGSIMRLAPVPIFFSADPEKAAEFSEESSRTTHPGPVAAAACHFLGFFLARAVSRDSSHATPAAFLDLTVKEYLNRDWPSAPHRQLVRLLRSAEPEGSRERCWNWRDADGPFLQETLEARGSTYNGYPVSPNYIGAYSLDGLAIAMHSFYHTVSFMEALTRCVNFLGDADSTGAICGQMAGAFYGLSAIDMRLVSRLRRWDCDEVALRGALLHVLGASLSVPSPRKPVNVMQALLMTTESTKTESASAGSPADSQS